MLSLRVNILELNQVFLNYVDESMQIILFEDVANLRFLFIGRVGKSLKENDQVILMVASHRLERNVAVNDMSVVCAF